MASAGGLYSHTLQDITNTKLEELTKKRKTFETHRQQTLANVQAVSDPVQKLNALVHGIKQCFGGASTAGPLLPGAAGGNRLGSDLKNIERFVKQARHDPSVSPNILESWRLTLVRHLNVQSLKFSYAALYGQLTTEWLQSTRKAPAVEEDADMGGGFEQVPGSQKLESRANWERAVFDAADVKEEDITQMLRGIFTADGDDDAKRLSEAQKSLKNEVRGFENLLGRGDNFDANSLSWILNSLLSSDLLTEEKRAVLKNFQGNDTVTNELADVLNMRMAAVDSWSWGDDIQLEQRRRLNGGFSIYMDEDLLQAIFLQYIGLKWSVFFKQALSRFRRHGAWKTPSSAIPTRAMSRRHFFLDLPTHGSLPSVASRKGRLYRQKFFLSELMSAEDQEIFGEEGEQEAEVLMHSQMHLQQQQQPQQMQQRQQMQQQLLQQQAASYPQAPRGRAKQMARKAHLHGGPAPKRKAAGTVVNRYYTETGDEMALEWSDDEDDSDEESKNPMDVKQTLLHLLSSDILIKTRLHGEVTCFRTQVQDFYSSLPHATIMAVLRFFGVSARWLGFFRRFLEAPLRFGEEEPRLRKRGTPGSHALSEVFGEIVLFCLDYKVNQATDGEILWRLNEDLWFWSQDQARCVKAWDTIQSVTRAMGLSLNPAKGGSACMKHNPDKIIEAGTAHPQLPQGDIRWGMLCLNPDTGRFEIDQVMVDGHIQELGRQLEQHSNSVFSWIQAWNTYASTFFTSNFGKPANCYGREHVDNMLTTHGRIQRELLPGQQGVIGHLKTVLAERFGVTDIPDAYFYFPVELGGLETRNPFIGLLQVRDQVPESPSKRLDLFLEAERTAYERAKKDFEARPDVDRDSKPFMPFEEYTQYREELGYDFSNELGDVFNWLMERPGEEPVWIERGGPVAMALTGLNGRSNKMRSGFETMEPYWNWVAQLYGPELIDQFGGFHIVDSGVLPMGMVNLFRSGRVKWHE